MNKVQRLREILPQVSITSDVIVGFPGEEDSDFQDTLGLVKKMEFDSIFSFKYSDRPYAKASLFKDKVPVAIKDRRLSILQRAQREITLKKNKRLEGNIEEVLVEGRSKKNGFELTGRTRSNRVVNFTGNYNLVGKLAKVKIEKAYLNSLRGTMVGN